MNNPILNKVASAILPLGIGLAAMQPLPSYANRGVYLPSNRILSKDLLLNKNTQIKNSLAIANSANLLPISTASSNDLELVQPVLKVVSQPLEADDVELLIFKPITELVIIDSAVPDKHVFYQKNKPGIDIVEIDSNKDGLKQLEHILNRYQDLDALHIVSHADDGVIYLGNSKVTESLLKKHVDILNTMDSAMKDGADLLLYGCDLAEGNKGESLLSLISNIANVDVAASNNKTGNGTQESDWKLEIHKGQIETQLAFSEIALKDFSSVLAFTGTIDFSTVTISGSYLGDTNTINSQVGAGVYLLNIDGADFSTGTFNGLSYSSNYESQITLLFNGGETFTPTSLFIYNISGTNDDFTVTSDQGGSISTGVMSSLTSTTVDLSSFGAGVSKLYITVSDGSGYFVLDNFAVSNVAPANASPVINNDNNNLTYTENDSATQVDSAATLSDADGDSDWNGGSLIAQITANNEAADELSIPDNVVGTINTSGTNILNGATTIGTLSASEGTVTNGTALTITFNANATNALVQQVLRAIDYRNTSDTPSTLNRTVTFTATDTNAASANDTRTITVASVNDDPTLVSLPSDITVTEDVASNLDFSAVTLSDVDSAANSVVMTFTASAGTLVSVSGGGVTIGGSGTNTLTLTGTVANIDSYLNTASNIKYTSVSNASGNNAATVAVKINDGGNAGSGGGLDVVFGTSNIDILGVNDEPVNSGNLPTDISVTEDTASNLDFSGMTLSDPDSASGNLLMTFTTNAGTLTATSAGGVTIGGSGTGVLTLTGTITNIDSYLNTVTNIKYTSALNMNGDNAATVSVKINDNGNSGIGAGSDIAFGTVNMDVTATNDLPSGSVTISGTKTQGQTLTANNTLADADGLGAFSFQWTRGGSNIAGATSSTYVLVQADVGNTMTVTISYTDGGATAESVTSGATASVANINDLPTGSVTISGTTTEGQTLTANNTLADADGLGSFSYQWARGGSNIAGATSSTYVLVQADVGSAITATISYTDGGSAAESVTSSPTAAIIDNDTAAPTFELGTPSLDLITRVGARLSVDLNEEGTVYYAVVLNAAAAPTVDDLVTGGVFFPVSSGSFATSSTIGSDAFSGLAVATNYDVYIVAQDTNGVPNVQSAVTKVDLLTSTNNAPVITLPPAPKVAQNQSNIALDDSISITDADGDLQSVTIIVTGGTVSITTGAVNIILGDGVDDAQLVFEGSLVDVNLALDGLTYTPTAGLSGANLGTIQIQIDDRFGGLDDKSLNINVTDLCFLVNRLPNAKIAVTLIECF